MEKQLKLYMVMLGCTPEGRLTEQHDIFFGIGPSLKELIPQMKASWPEAKGRIHIDAWREISVVDQFSITIEDRDTAINTASEKLFFINLGGYKENEFEEYHYKVLAVAKNKAEAIKKSKQTAFYKHCGFKEATSHIDDKFGVDVDDMYEIKDVLSDEIKSKFQLKITKTDIETEDKKHIGYLKLEKIK